jgi:hypothetical protein
MQLDFQIAGANGWALRIEQNCNWAACRLREPAYALSRKTSVPFWINCRSVSVFSVAGPRVQMILVFRMDQTNTFH